MVYFVGIYARLSVDVDDRKRESIETQIAAARSFVKAQKDMIEIQCYTDIGATGMTFERKGFLRMMQDIYSGKINCIVVKDLSRLGRNYIETGKYIETVFPTAQVRFIAVADGIDSAVLDGAGQLWKIRFQNLVNELYVRDIAVKTASSKQQQWEQGNFTGGIPPYGYRIGWKDGRRCLVVEQGTSQIVKDMYEFCLSGKSIGNIAAWLYQQRIVNPAKYHQTGTIYAKDGEALRMWSKMTIRNILQNPVYIGKLVHKTSREVNPYRQEVIIEEDVFYAVKEKFQQTKIPISKHSQLSTVKRSLEKNSPEENNEKENIFAECLYCGVCGNKMVRKTIVKRNRFMEKTRSYRYVCVDKECRMKSISYRVLYDFIRETMAYMMQHTKSMEHFFVWEKRRQKILMLASDQYLQYQLGEKEAGDFQKNVTQWKQKLDLAKREAEKERAVFDYLECKNIILTSKMIKLWIQKIEIYPDHRIFVKCFCREPDNFKNFCGCQGNKK